jgi:glycine oxidase
VIGRAGIEGLVYATGHYRNGILLAPITAASVGSIMDNRPASVPLEAVAPSRFAV